MLLERLGLHQCQGKCGQPVRSKSRIPFEGVSVIVPPIAKHPCICRHRWNPNPTQGPFVKRIAMHLGQFTVISLAENVTALYRVLPVCQSGHINPVSQKASPFLTGSMWPLSMTTSPRLGVSPAARSLQRAKSSKRMGLLGHQ